MEATATARFVAKSRAHATRLPDRRPTRLYTSQSRDTAEELGRPPTQVPFAFIRELQRTGPSAFVVPRWASGSIARRRFAMGARVRQGSAWGAILAAIVIGSCSSPTGPFPESI
jgi:hypothetical protein